jgi:hypothetical protein
VLVLIGPSSRRDNYRRYKNQPAGI